MYMCIYIHIKQKFCALIPGFSRSRERKLLLKWSLQNGHFLIPWFQRKQARFVVPDVNYFFILFLTHLGLLVVTSWPGFFFVLLLLIFIFWVNFVTSDALWEKLLCCVGFFSVVTGEEKKRKEKCEHGASYARHGNFCLLGSLCISVLNWNYQITASECQRGFICYSNILPKTISASKLTEVCLFALVYF